MVPSRPLRLTVPSCEPVWDTARVTIRPLFDLLSSHQPIDDRERESLSRFLQVVPTLPDPFNEEAGLLHVTASAIVVSDAGDKTALHLHKRLGIWLQPGGHIEAGEMPADGALREAIEEIGVPARHQADGGLFMHIDVHPGPRGHTHFDLRYLVRSPEVAPVPGEGESPVVGWFSWEEADAMADPGLVGALRVARILVG